METCMQAPLLVETNMMSSAVKASFLPVFVVSADACARAVVRRIGHGWLWVPNLAHQVQWWLAGCVPELVLDAYRLALHLQQRDIFRMLKPSRAAPKGQGCSSSGDNDY